MGYPIFVIIITIIEKKTFTSLSEPIKFTVRFSVVPLCDGLFKGIGESFRPRSHIVRSNPIRLKILPGVPKGTCEGLIRSPDT